MYLLVVLVILLIFLMLLPKKVAVCSYSDRPEMTKYTWDRLARYCKKHGYEFVGRRTMPDTGRHQSWNKIPLIEELSRKHDIVAWVDDDILITDMEKPLEFFMDDFENSNCKIALQTDAAGGSTQDFNAGFLIVKKGSSELLNQIWEEAEGEAHMTEPNWEQIAMWNLSKKDPKFKDNLYVFPHRTIQSFYNENVGEISQWKEGDFSVHFAGVPDRADTIMRFATR